MLSSSRIAAIYLILLNSSFFLLNAQTTEKIEHSLPIFSTATVTNYPMAAGQHEASRLLSLTEQSLSSSTKDFVGVQVIVNCNTQTYRGFIGPRLDDTLAYSASNPGLYNFSGKNARIQNLLPGAYTMSIHQDGYQDLNLKITIAEGKQYWLNIQLVARNGMIDIVGDRPIQTIEIDGETITSASLLLSEGRHRVRARTFAFEDYQQSIYITEDTVTKLDIHFIPANFRLSNTEVSRSRFRPANFGTLGTTTISFDVTSLGSANIKITNQEGKEIRNQQIPAFSTWTQTFVWEGADNEGNLLPEGTYNWTIDAHPDPGVEGTAVILKGNVAIDYSSYIKFRSLWSGSPGLDFVSDVYSLAPAAIQIGSRLALLSAGISPNTSTKFLVDMDIRYGLIQNFELWFNANGDVEIAGSGSSQMLLGGGVGWSVIPLPGINPTETTSKIDFGLKLNLSGAGFLYSSIHYPYELDEAGIMPGGRFGIAGQARWGILSIVLEPVVHLSTWPLHLNDSGSSDLTGLPAMSANFFGSLHMGLYIDTDRFLAGISAAVYTASAFTAIQLPIRTGINIQFMPIESFMLGLNFQIKLGIAKQLEPSGGLTIGFIQ